MIQEQKTKQQVSIVLSKDAGSNHSKSPDAQSGLHCNVILLFFFSLSLEVLSCQFEPTSS
jgi:hypothetical protein